MNESFVAADNLPDLVKQVQACTRCVLFKSATHGVPGEGPLKAQIMFIGEGPGENEDRQGRPFVGASGHFLNELLGQIGLRREDVYITNVVKHRPPQNRDPLPEEILACKPYLDRQIELIQPKVIVTISRFAMARWFGKEKISQIHGQARHFGNLLVVPMYHPAAALHQQSLRQVIVDDFKKLPGYIQSAGRAQPGHRAEEKKEKPSSEQLKLF